MSKISNTPVQPLTTNSVVSYLTEKIRTTRREFLQTTTATSTNLTKSLHSVLVTVDEPRLLACTLGSSLCTYTLFHQTFLSLISPILPSCLLSPTTNSWFSSDLIHQQHLAFRTPYSLFWTCLGHSFSFFQLGWTLFVVHNTEY